MHVFENVSDEGDRSLLMVIETAGSRDITLPCVRARLCTSARVAELMVCLQVWAVSETSLSDTDNTVSSQ